MHLHTSIHLLRYFQNKELDELYVSLAIRNFALGLISIFIPIYLIKQGFSITFVLLFYSIIHLTHFILTIPVVELSRKITYKTTMILSTPFLILFYFILYTIPPDSTRTSTFLLLGFIFGINNVLFWIGYHLFMAKHSDEGLRGEEIAVVTTINFLLTIISPFIGGLILSFASFKELFFIVSLLLLSSTIPLFMVKERVDDSYKRRGKKLSKNIRVKELFNNLLIKKLFIRRGKDAVSFFVYGIEGGTQIILWPIFLYFTLLNNYAKLGFFNSTLLMTAVITTLIIGKLTDINKRIVLLFGTFTTAIVWIFRALIVTPTQALFSNITYGITKTALHIPIDTITYERANMEARVKGSKENMEGRIGDYIIMRELFINLGRTTFLLLLSLFLNLFLINTSLSRGSDISDVMNKLRIVFIIVGLLTMFYSLLSSSSSSPSPALAKNNARSN